MARRSGSETAAHSHSDHALQCRGGRHGPPYRRNPRTVRQRFARSALLHSRVRPSRIEVQALSRLSGQLGKIGSNVNQIAYHLNAGRPGDRVEGSLLETLRDLKELRIVILQALGKEPRRDKTAYAED